jgi:hypothetical protein
MFTKNKGPIDIREMHNVRKYKVGTLYKTPGYRTVKYVKIDAGVIKQDGSKMRWIFYGWITW